MGLLDFLLGVHRFENDALNAIKCKFPWQLGKVMKIEVQSISMNLKVIKKEKIKQTTLRGLLKKINIRKNMYRYQTVPPPPPNTKLTDELRIDLPNTGASD